MPTRPKRPGFRKEGWRDTRYCSNSTVGAAAFADAGRTWGQDVAGQEPLGLLYDVGVGLRIGNARSGLGNVLHFDLAVPLSRQPGIDSMQLLVETRHSF